MDFRWICGISRVGSEESLFLFIYTRSLRGAAPQRAAAGGVGRVGRWAADAATTAAPSDPGGAGSDTQRQRGHASEPGDWLYGDKGNKFVACRGGAEDGGAAGWPEPAPRHQAPGKKWRAS